MIILVLTQPSLVKEVTAQRLKIRVEKAGDFGENRGSAIYQLFSLALVSPSLKKRQTRESVGPCQGRELYSVLASTFSLTVALWVPGPGPLSSFLKK